jgi:polygalacturonase
MQLSNKIKIFLLSLASYISFAAQAQNGKVFYNVKDFGAKGDGAAINSDAINKAIDAAAAEGGGTVYFPAGNYLSGSIHLKSNICL